MPCVAAATNRATAKQCLPDDAPLRRTSCVNYRQDLADTEPVEENPAITSAVPPRKASITAIAYHLPLTSLTNDDLVREYPDWDVEKIFAKTGISCRRIAAPDQTAGDLALEAGRELITAWGGRRDDIDLLILCTQTPDYALPTTACILQDRLGLSTTCAAFDLNLGCSGFVYGLAIVKGMLETGQAGRALLINAETYSKWIDPDDRSVRTIFGDGAAATIVELVECSDGPDPIGPFVFGTDGRGYDKLIVHGSGARGLEAPGLACLREGRRADRLFMDGPEIFTFTIRTVPRTVRSLLEKAGLRMADVDLFVFHQANSYMLEHLRKQCRIPQEKFFLSLEQYGNTVSSTIPIALKDAADKGALKDGMRVAVVGFGVGYSWAAATLIWNGQPSCGE